MNKNDIIDHVAETTGLSKADATRAVDAFTSGVSSALKSGDSVALVGFGTFKASDRAAREGKNPKTGEVLQIAATTVPKFTPGASFKAAVAKK